MQHIEQTLWAITPIDGRYRHSLNNIDQCLSEGALIHYRIKIELSWLLHLVDMMTEKQLPPIIQCPDTLKTKIKAWIQHPPKNAAQQVKQIEKDINHDVKAVEYYLRKLLSEHDADKTLLSFIHFACTSEDINNLAYALMIKEINTQFIVPNLTNTITALATKATDYAGLPMLSKTHGQAASPTTLGKEFAVFAHRLQQGKKNLLSLPMMGKINGAVGNYNAHHLVFPKANWENIAKTFVEEKLQLNWTPISTQIDTHDWLARFCYELSLINTISIDLCRDIWGYISFNLLKQKPNKKEVGSSTMPHKINPIDYENAEGNFGLSTALSNHLACKLPISRFQRDLSDSTALRSLNTMLSHHLLAQQSLLKGLKKTIANTDQLKQELDLHWEVLAEPIQMIMRRYGVIDAYERLKDLTRGKHINQIELTKLINQTEELPEHEKEILKKLTPSHYSGYAEKIAHRTAKECRISNETTTL